MKEQRPQGEHRRLPADGRPQPVLLRGLQAGAAPVPLPHLVGKGKLAKAIHVADSHPLLGKIVEQAAVVEVHGGVAPLPRLGQEVHHRGQGSQLLPGGEGPEPLPGGGKPLPLVPVEIPVVVQALPLLPGEDQPEQASSGPRLPQPHQVGMGQVPVDGLRPAQVFHRLLGAHRSLGRGKARHLEKVPLLPVSHPEAHIARVILVKHGEHFPVIRQKRKVSRPPQFHGHPV